jgi:peroxiredoxin
MPAWLSKHWNIITSITLAAGAGWILLTAALFGSETAPIRAPQKGFYAPDFSLADADGNRVTLSELRGQAVLINVWASWCPPCRAEMPAMQRAYTDYAEAGFVILAINQTSQDSRVAALEFAAEHSLTFPILFDDTGEASQRYATSALPTSFFVDRAGVIQEVVIGGPMSEALLRARIEALLEMP